MRWDSADQAALSPATLEGGRHPYLEQLINDAEDFPDPNVVFERRLALVIDGLAVSLGVTDRPAVP